MEEYNIRQVIVVRKDLNMRKGKMCAQVAHASNAFLMKLIEKMEECGPNEYKDLSDIYDDWVENHYTKIVLSVDSKQELRDLINRAEELGIESYPIYDLGLTEFHENVTLTCASFGPDDKEKLDQLTGHLKLI